MYTVEKKKLFEIRRRKENEYTKHGCLMHINEFLSFPGYGILSPSAVENPTWYNANHV